MSQIAAALTSRTSSGGALLRTEDREAIEAVLRQRADEINLTGEIKWQKVTENYLEKYIWFIDTFFDFVASGRIKVRIMFTQNRNVATDLSSEQREQEYFLLYYQLFKNAFGIKYCNPNELDRVYFSLMIDSIPDTKIKSTNFKERISRIPNTQDFIGANIEIPRQDIVEVNSHDHIILQGLDVILGSMSFKLNDKHKVKPLGSRIRGKRTRAKESLYRHINSRIHAIYPRFNVGVSTRAQFVEHRWHHPYRHWLLVPRNRQVDPNIVKPR